jgi:hypothetical protein
VDDKAPYYAALEAADRAWNESDASKLEAMLEAMLAKQLISAAGEASQSQQQT